MLKLKRTEKICQYFTFNMGKILHWTFKLLMMAGETMNSLNVCVFKKKILFLAFNKIFWK